MRSRSARIAARHSGGDLAHSRAGRAGGRRRAEPLGPVGAGRHHALRPWPSLFARPVPGLLQETLLLPVFWGEALYVPPFARASLLRSAPAFERIAGRFSLPGAGVHVVEATKQLYRPAACAAPCAARCSRSMRCSPRSAPAPAATASPRAEAKLSARRAAASGGRIRPAGRSFSPGTARHAAGRHCRCHGRGRRRDAIASAHSALASALAESSSASAGIIESSSPWTSRTAGGLVPNCGGMSAGSAPATRTPE